GQSQFCSLVLRGGHIDQWLLPRTGRAELARVQPDWIAYKCRLPGLDEHCCHSGFEPCRGTLVDRQNRRLMMIICDLVRSASLVILAFALIAFGFNLLLILAVSFTLGAFSTVFYPAERALMP